MPSSSAVSSSPAIASPRFRVLILGGYGLFGGRIVRALARDAGLHLIVAGRDRARAEAFVASLDAPNASIETAALDTEAADFPTRLLALAPQVLIDTAGPFQARQARTQAPDDAAGSSVYRVARAALAAGAHAIDLADGRDYVRGIVALDVEAKAAGRWVVSGASSVPGLNAAVIEAHRERFAELDTVESTISPGNRTPRGWATTLAILSYSGKPYRMLRDGMWRTAHGWQSLRRLRVAGVGARWAVRCEVPDLDLLPVRYPSLRTVEFRAGLELWRMHFGLWLATWLVRAGLVRDLRRFGKPLFWLSERWQNVGSDAGFMHVRLGGRGDDGARQRLDWTLIARNGDGPQIPATAAVLLTRKLARGALPGAGATPCLDLFTLDEFLGTLDGYAMEARVETMRERE
ncbi:MAG: saccharopine dehydrogenase NADP-binding domain-containing protein [Lysobacter sp.]|nr:saccharopine dehydrogenase NADP-binding domain-containing protein [Lysobacter sp.]